MPFGYSQYKSVDILHYRDNQYGDTPLHAATRMLDFEIMQLLLDSGADVNAKNAIGHSPLWIAVCNSWTWYDQKKKIFCVKWLIQHGADVNSQDNEKRSLLMLSVHLRFEEITILLIYHGANAGVIDSNGNSVIHWVFPPHKYRYVLPSSSYVDSVLELLSARDINIISMLDLKNIKGNTPLHTAIEEATMI